MAALRSICGHGTAAASQMRTDQLLATRLLMSRASSDAKDFGNDAGARRVDKDSLKLGPAHVHVDVEIDGADAGLRGPMRAAFVPFAGASAGVAHVRQPEAAPLR